ncbi:MAG: hypothetical protein DI535_07785 [Citrobacter freundii]|nr:MAG: hypothetical protein DI535_07785 [Citrobacter freundii]
MTQILKAFPQDLIIHFPAAVSLLLHIAKLYPEKSGRMGFSSLNNVFSCCYHDLSFQYIVLLLQEYKVFAGVLINTSKADDLKSTR